MSAESKESQPSIDDILSSIREIIADDSADAGADEANTPRNGHAEPAAQNQRDIMSVLRGGQTQASGQDTASENAVELVEDVLDLSEEFIVTEETEATSRDQGHVVEGEAAAQSPESDSTDEELAGETTPAENPDNDMIAQADVWAQDFQMPVGEEGPASPFTAAQTHPESTWPSNDPFDVTESYKLARSMEPSARFARNDVDREAQAAEPAQEEIVDTHAETVEPEAEPGIELASLSEAESEETPSDHDFAEAAADETPVIDDEPQPESDQLRAFPAADELEAVFGMPPRQWVGPQQPQLDMQPETAAPSGEEPEEHGQDALPEREFHDWPAEAADDNTMSAPHDVGPSGEPVSEQYEPRNAPHPARAPEGPAQPSTPEPAPVSAAAMGGKTLEDSVKELLRPMLQEWLDKNMPRLVEAAMREQMAASDERGGDHGGLTAKDERRDDER